ncbi:MAG TPA: histidine kinase, partial [Bacteroidales bacterium]|nr:histidine kinase [Bacteroidales bacterium]
NSLLQIQNKTIEEQNLKLIELNATKDKFFNIIAHDLKNPFNSILGFSNLLIDSLERQDRKQDLEQAGYIKTSALSAYKLLENLLAWAQTQTGRFDFRPELVAVHELIEETVLVTAGLAKVKEIVISTNLEQVKTIADHNMLNTILRNLLTNAIKFTSKQGQICITCKLDNNEILVSIADNGVGIPQNRISKLFNIAEITTTQGTEKEKGTGLGLLLCKEFVEKHGGKIIVESEVGKGTVFTFSLHVKLLK